MVQENSIIAIIIIFYIGIAIVLGIFICWPRRTRGSSAGSSSSYQLSSDGLESGTTSRSSSSSPPPPGPAGRFDDLGGRNDGGFNVYSPLGRGRGGIGGNWSAIRGGRGRGGVAADYRDGGLNVAGGPDGDTMLQAVGAH